MWTQNRNILTLILAGLLLNNTFPESEAFHAEQLVNSFAEQMPDMDAEFPALLLQAILTICNWAKDMIDEFGVWAFSMHEYQRMCLCWEGGARNVSTLLCVS